LKNTNILISPTVIFLVLFLLSWLLPVLQQNLHAAENGASEEDASDVAVSEAESTSDETKSEVSNKPTRIHLLPEVMEQAALADETIKKQIVWLDTPEGKGKANIKFLGLETHEHTSEPQGAVLFLHGVDQHPDWPKVIKPLRTVLPENGWYTFSIMLPYESYTKPPARELEAKATGSVEVTDGMPLFSGRYSKLDSDDADKALESSEEKESSDEQVEKTEIADTETIEGEPTETAADLALADGSADDSEEVIDVSVDDKKKGKISVLNFDDKVSLRLAAALAHIAEQGLQNIVLLGYQQGAESVLNYLSENKGMLPEKGLTVIWVDASFSERAQNRMGTLLEKNSPLLILDIVDSSSGSRDVAAKRRVSDAKRQNYMGYSQVKLPISTSATLMRSSLTQRIKGWLKVNAEGMSAEKFMAR